MEEWITHSTCALAAHDVCCLGQWQHHRSAHRASLSCFLRPAVFKADGQSGDSIVNHNAVRLTLYQAEGVQRVCRLPYAHAHGHTAHLACPSQLSPSACKLTVLSIADILSHEARLHQLAPHLWLHVRCEALVRLAAGTTRCCYGVLLRSVQCMSDHKFGNTPGADALELRAISSCAESRTHACLHMASCWCACVLSAHACNK